MARVFVKVDATNLCELVRHVLFAAVAAVVVKAEMVFRFLERKVRERRMLLPTFD